MLRNICIDIVEGVIQCHDDRKKGLSRDGANDGLFGPSDPQTGKIQMFTLHRLRERKNTYWGDTEHESWLNYRFLSVRRKNSRLCLRRLGLAFLAVVMAIHITPLHKAGK